MTLLGVSGPVCRQCALGLADHVTDRAEAERRGLRAAAFGPPFDGTWCLPELEAKGRLMDRSIEACRGITDELERRDSEG